MQTNHTEAFVSLASAWQNMLVDWQGNSVKAFVGSLVSYLFGVQNWELLFILLIAICLDTMLGMAKAFKLKVFSSKGMGKLLFKVPLYAATLVMTHIAVHIVKIQGGVDLAVLDAGAYLFLIFRELKGSSEKLTFFDINFTAPVRALEHIMSRNSRETRADRD